MMIMMLFPKEKTLLLLSSAIIILLCISVSALSLDSGIASIRNTGTIKTLGEYPSSTFTYRIFRNSTSTYRINSAGVVDDHNSDPAVVINNALWDCSSVHGGSIYVVPNTYLTSTFIGGNPLYTNDFSNIYLLLGNGTIIQRSGGTGDGDYIFYLNGAGAGTTFTNFTLASNGTAYLNSAGYCNGVCVTQSLNFTMYNITVQHTYGAGIFLRQCRYPDIENVSVFSNSEHYAAMIMLLSDVQYGTFKHLNLDGNCSAYSAEGLYLGDSDSNVNWNGSYFNTFSDIWVHNVRQNGIYLSSSEDIYGTYNNTFTNCTIENNWADGYFGIKLRPAKNNTFTNIVMRNMTGGVTTGTTYDASSPYNCTGNSVQATCYNMKTQPFTLTTDGDNQSVDHNFFNLTISNSPGTYFSSGTNSKLYDNTIYISMTNCTIGLYFEEGYIQDNVFVANFLNCGAAGHADIWFYNSPTDPNIARNTIYILSESGNPHGQLEGSLGTNQIFNGPPP